MGMQFYVCVCSYECARMGMCMCAMWLLLESVREMHGGVKEGSIF